MGALTLLEKPVSVDEKSSEYKEGEPTAKIEQEIELPKERICWPITLNELYFNIGTIYAFKLLFQGRVGLASTLTGKELFGNKFSLRVV